MLLFVYFVRRIKKETAQIIILRKLRTILVLVERWDLWVTGKKLNDLWSRANIISNRLSIQRVYNFMLDIGGFRCYAPIRNSYCSCVTKWGWTCVFYNGIGRIREEINLFVHQWKVQTEYKLIIANDMYLN